MEHTYDVIIIGAGQAGTAMRKQLKQGGVENHLMIDAQKHIGESWRLPYNSLVLFTPKSYSSLPGLEMKGDPNSYPKKNEMADYLEVYVAHFKLPYQLDTMVTKAEKQKSHFNIHTLHETIQSRNVVVACGAFQKPYVPPVV